MKILFTILAGMIFILDYPVFAIDALSQVEGFGGGGVPQRHFEERDRLIVPEAVSPEVDCAVSFNNEHVKIKHTLIAEKLKDILSESPNSVASDGIYVFLNSSGAVVVERAGIVVRVFKDPLIEKELLLLFKKSKEEVVESWEEETLSISAEGLVKKVCRYFFEKVCEWVSCPYPLSTPEAYNACVPLCKVRITPLYCKETPQGVKKGGYNAH